jgi:hypothetical protein
MTTHSDAKLRLNALYHLYWAIDHRVFDGETDPVTFIGEAHPEVACWFSERWEARHADEFDWQDTVDELIMEEM